MPKYNCEYCDTSLTHDSPSVRKTHTNGRKHKENVRIFYQKWLEEQVQKLVDDSNFKQDKNARGHTAVIQSAAAQQLGAGGGGGGGALLGMGPPRAPAPMGMMPPPGHMMRPPMGMGGPPMGMGGPPMGMMMGRPPMGGPPPMMMGRPPMGGPHGPR